MGLLDFIKTGTTGNPALDQGLLQAGLSLLQGRGNFGANLGRAGMDALTGAQIAHNQQFQRAIQKNQLDELQRKRVLEDLPGQFIKPAQVGVDATGGMETATSNPANYVPPSMDLAGLAQKYLGTPGGFQQGLALQEYLKPKAPKLTAVGPDTALVNEATGEEVYRGPAKQDTPSAVREYEYAKSQGYPGTFEQWDTARRRAGASSVSVNTKQETEEAKIVGKAFGEQFAKLQEADLAAAGKLNKLNRFEQLTQSVSTGKFAPAGKEVASALQSLGLSVDPNLGNKEAMEALGNELALEARNPSGGAGMPGAMSDADRQFLTNIVPSLSKTPDGNKKLIETAKKIARRDQQVAKLARDYRAKRGTLDEGFYNELQEFSAKNPLFHGQSKGVVRTGTLNGRKVREMSDGSIEYAD